MNGELILILLCLKGYKTIFSNYRKNKDYDNQDSPENAQREHFELVELAFFILRHIIVLWMK